MKSGKFCFPVSIAVFAVSFIPLNLLKHFRRLKIRSWAGMAKMNITPRTPIPMTVMVAEMIRLKEFTRYICAVIVLDDGKIRQL